MPPGLRKISDCNMRQKLISFTNFNAHFLYSLTICMLHYNPRHVSSINMPIFRRTNCNVTASGIVTLCTVQYSMPDESRLLCSLLSSGILYCTVNHINRKCKYLSYEYFVIYTNQFRTLGTHMAIPNGPTYCKVWSNLLLRAGPNLQHIYP